MSAAGPFPRRELPLAGLSPHRSPVGAGAWRRAATGRRDARPARALGRCSCRGARWRPGSSRWSRRRWCCPSSTSRCSTTSAWRRWSSLGLVVMTGVAGIVSFGQQAFVGIAAYATAALTTLAGWSPWGGLAASLACVAACALLIGLVTLRLSGHYLSIATIAWGIAIYYLFGNLPQLGQYSGIDNVPAVSRRRLGLRQRPQVLPADLGVSPRPRWSPRSNLLDSRSGRAIRALRFRSRDGRELRRRHLGAQARRVRLGRAAGRPGGLAARALPALRQPARLRRQRRHRLPVHGRDRRREPASGARSSARRS